MTALSVPRVRLRGIRRPSLGVLIPIGLLVYLVILPLFVLVWGSFQSGISTGTATLTVENYATAYSDPFTYSTLLNSIVYAGASAVLAFVVGGAMAWFNERTNTPLSRLTVPIVLIPFLLPGILVSVSWIFLLSPKFGYVNTLLMAVFGLTSAPFDIFSIAGMIWVHAIESVPLAFLLMAAALKSMDPTLEESAMMSGASNRQILRRVTSGLVRPASAAVLLILFVRGLESFETPALIGIPAQKYVYASAIYLAFSDYPPDYGMGAALAVGLLVLSAVGIWLYTRLTRSSERFQTVSGKGFRPRKLELGAWRWLGTALLLGYGLVAVVLPILILAWASLLPYFATPSSDTAAQLSLDNYRSLLGDNDFLVALTNSIVLAVATAAVVMALAAILSWIVLRTTLRGRSVVENMSFLPLAVPGLVLGMALIWFYVAVPLPIYGTLWVLLIAYTTRFIPFGMRAASSSMIQVHKELEESGYMAGGSQREVFRKITVPLLRPGLVAGWVYVCILAFREFSTSILLSSADSKVLSILVFSLYTQGETAEVAAIGIVMIVALLAVVGVSYKLLGRIGLGGV